MTAAAIVGCSSSDDAPKYPTADSFCDARATAECAKVADLCLVTKEACVAERKQACTAFAGASVSATRAYQPKNAEACLGAVNAAYAKGNLTARDLDETIAGTMAERCARVFEGVAKKGEACASSFDCQGGLVCATARTPGARPTCATATPRSLGDGCANAGDTCAASAYCAIDSVTCVAARKKGEPCAEAVPCEAGLRCDATCKDKAAVGQPCTKNADCANDGYCLPLTTGSLCAPRLDFSAEASICQSYGK